MPRISRASNPGRITGPQASAAIATPGLRIHQPLSPGISGSTYNGGGWTVSTDNGLAEWQLGGWVGVLGSAATGLSGYPGGLAAYVKPADGTAPGTLVEVMRIDTNGNTGIGTNAPGDKLDVAGGLRWLPAASATPTVNGQLAVQATSNTSLTFKFKGSDGVVRSGSLTLA